MEHKSNKDSYSHILKYTSLFGSIQGLSVLIALVRNKMVAILLGPQGMGLVSLFNSTVAFISNASGLGLPVSSIKTLSETFESGDEHETRRIIKIIRTWVLFTALAGMLLCVLLAPFFNAMTFSWGDHTLHYVILFPVVGLTVLVSGETAILKGVRMLRPLAKVSVYNAVLAVVTTVPLYYLFGQAAIIPSLIIVVLVQMIFTVYFSYRKYPLSFTFSSEDLHCGWGMVKLGVAFVSGGLFTSGADFIIRSYINNVGSLDVLGIYNAGYMMTMTYAGMVFAAMETDFFPRLSAVNGDTCVCNDIVNKQIEVSLLMISPLLVIFTISLPVLIPFLFSNEFLSVISMVQIAILAMYLRAAKLPVAYLTLAKGDSRNFFFLEAYSAVLMVLLAVAGFYYWGLVGIGWAMFITELVDIFVINIFARHRYSYVLSSSVCLTLSLQLPIALFSYISVAFTSGYLYWLGGLTLALLSCFISVYQLKRKHD